MKNTIQAYMPINNESCVSKMFPIPSLQKGQLLSNKIEMAIKQKGYNRQQFASIMGVQPSIITRWLSGNHNFTVETLFEIENKLEIQLLAIERPISKQINLHMIVGSERTQNLNSSLVEGLSSMLPSRVTYCIGSNVNYIENLEDNSGLMGFFKIENK